MNARDDKPVLITGPSARFPGQIMAMLVLAAMLGFVLDATWLCRAVDRLSKLGHGSEGEHGGEGHGGPGPDPARPRPPSEEPDWWPEFERDFRSYREARERAPVAG